MNTVNEGAILERALKLPPKERALYLDVSCGGDAALRERVLLKLAKALERTGAAPDVLDASQESTVVVAPLEPCEKPGDRLGRYQLLELLGEGGMGSVWLAEQTEPVRRKVAVKVIKPGMDTREVVARFEAERQALALMTHRDIAKVFDAGVTEKGRPFFVMEFVSGIRITDYCDKHNLRTHERLALFIQVCQAIEHAHQKGIIHRDLKPANILVTLHEGVPVPKIIDFGIAKAVAGQRLTEKTLHTGFEQFMGTPTYMSPEQAEMNPLGIDARTDIYSLGVLLYELLTGCTPFDAQRLKTLGPDQIRRIIREEEPPAPSKRLTTLSAAERATVAKRHQCHPPKLLDIVRNDLDWVVMKCLEKDRTRRYSSAADLARDVQNYLDQKPVTARPPTWGYRVGKHLRRRRRAIALAGGTALLTLLATGLLLSLLPRPPRSSTPLSPAQEWEQTLDWLANYDCSSNLAAALSYFQQTTNSSHEVLAKRAWANWLLYVDQESDSALSDAETFATQSWKLNTNDFEALLVLGLVAKARGDFVAATNHLLMAEKKSHSANGQVLISLALTCLAAGNFPDATNYAQMAEDLPTNPWTVFDSLGTFRYLTRELARARRAFEQAVKLAPQSPLAHRHLGQILLLQPQSQNRARGEFEEALKRNRTAPNLFGVGKAYQAVANYSEAAKYFQQAIQLDSSKYIYHIGLADALRMLPGRGDEALQEFEKASRQIQDMIGPERKPLLAAYHGVCEAGLGQTNAALNDLEFARPEAARDARVRAVLIEGYNLLGDTKVVEELKRLRPGAPPSTNSVH